ncbi:hypothetical protein ACIHCM_37215 [Streptomyces sp. NPDC052023]|uniref:hypothetical protein n=1 Tax=Streptomyces sp. NPDC052023 TaxID=3365681 RepID=UPI0037D070B9
MRELIGRVFRTGACRRAAGRLRGHGEQLVLVAEDGRRLAPVDEVIVLTHLWCLTTRAGSARVGRAGACEASPQALDLVVQGDQPGSRQGPERRQLRQCLDAGSDPLLQVEDLSFEPFDPGGPGIDDLSGGTDFRPAAVRRAGSPSGGSGCG